MSDLRPNGVDLQGFVHKAEAAFRALFSAAQAKDELQFALALNPEFRGTRDAGWNTSREAEQAFEDYVEFLGTYPVTRLKARVALGFYCHLAEASGFYEVPKNMLRIVAGEQHSMWPFHSLVRQHRMTGESIAPNANRIFADLIGHAVAVGQPALAEVLRDAFDPDLRNGYAHADYVVWKDGIRLPKRNGGSLRLIGWDEFDERLQRGIQFYDCLRTVSQHFIASYDPPKVVRARLGDDPECDWCIAFDPRQGSFEIRTGA